MCIAYDTQAPVIKPKITPSDTCNIHTEQPSHSTGVGGGEQDTNDKTKEEDTNDKTKEGDTNDKTKEGDTNDKTKEGDTNDKTKEEDTNAKHVSSLSVSHSRKN